MPGNFKAEFYETIHNPHFHLKSSRYPSLHQDLQVDLELNKKGYWKLPNFLKTGITELFLRKIMNFIMIWEI